MHPLARRAAAALSVAAALVAALLVCALSTSPSAGAAGTPTATFTKTADWGTGYEGKYTVTNGGTTTLTGWRVEFDLPATTTVSSFWDGALTRSGTHYTVSNVGW
ncbi:MAG TPA: cellulose binding domain-containing protein, partial [Mycobacteriales bacterium]|nr:cellulose binding domain-containing protein [Mycobacteriales bacterium]